MSHGGLSDIRQHAATGVQHCRHIRTQKTQAVSQFFIPSSSFETDMVWDIMLRDIMSDFLSGCAFARRCQCMGIAYFSKLLWFD